MLRSLKEMIGYTLASEDGAVGKVKDFLFDQKHWTVRWLVADTGNWLPGRKVLISPISLGEPNWEASIFPVRLTKEKIENSPDLDSDAPVSREYETRWFQNYGWPYYWAGGGIWGEVGFPAELYTRQEKERTIEENPEEKTMVVRSVKEVTGYHIDALDGEIGHVAEFVVEDKAWTLRYLVVDTRNWLPGRKVLVSPSWVDAIEWGDRKVKVHLTQQAVKQSPKYDPAAPINREYEARLYDYYGRPVYWE